MSIVVRSPSSAYARKPGVTVLRSGTPVAVVIEIFEAYDAARAIASGRRIVVTALAAIAPVIELIGSPELLDFRIQRLGAGEHCALASVQSVALSVAGGFTLPLTNGDGSGVPVFGCVETVAARLVDREGLVGGVDFENIVAVQIPNANIRPCPS